MLRLRKPIYGLPDSDDYWDRTLNIHLGNDLAMKCTPGDPSLFSKTSKGKFVGNIGSYVDDKLAAGDEHFERESGTTETAFESSERIYEDVKFSGIQIIKINGNFFMTQSRYTAKIELLPTSSDFKAFRSLMQNISWVCHTRPYITAPFNIFSKIT